LNSGVGSPGTSVTGGWDGELDVTTTLAALVLVTLVSETDGLGSNPVVEEPSVRRTVSPALRQNNVPKAMFSVTSSGPNTVTVTDLVATRCSSTSYNAV
jgi:hypothetical protein